MRTVFRIAALVLLTALAVPSFGQADPTGAVITYWYQHTQGRETALQAMIARFNQTNPWHITVKGEYAGSYPEIFNKMSAGIAGGVTPDLVVAYQNQADAYRQAGAIVNLDPYVSDAKYGLTATELKDFFADFLAQDVNPRFAERLGWPPNRSLEVMYYNADWLKALGFKAPPKTWAEFADACRKATDAAKGTVGYEVKTDASEVFAQVISRGGTFTTADGKGYRLDGPEMKATLKFMQDLYKSGVVRKVAERFGDQTDFANGKVLFVFDSTAGMPFYAKAVTGSAKPFAWTVAPLPHDTPQAVSDVYGASVSIVKSTPARQQAAWLFLKWMSEPAQQAEWVRVSNYFPVRRSTAAGLSDYLKANPVFAQAFDLLSTGTEKSEPGLPGYEQVRDAITTAYQQIIDGADVAQTLTAVQKKADKALRDGS
jgi:multiple sugar transport system substrate-binding protein/sn-glycerol 3-phosphate transport system substrate-binding protein